MTPKEQQLHDALSKAKQWIDNWSPSFTNDDDWAAVEADMVAALKDEIVDALEGPVFTEVTDITPTYEPISMAREMVNRAPRAVAAVGILIAEDGGLWRATCGHQKQQVLWALTA